MTEPRDKATCDMPPYGVATGGEAADSLTGPSLADGSGRWVLAAAILAAGMIFIDNTALNVALPAVQTALDASGAQLLWIMNAYLVMLAAFMLMGGSMGDKLGRKKVFMAGIGLFLLGMLAAGAAGDVHFLIAARVVQGIGAAFLIPGSLSLITANFDSSRRGRAIGTWAAATAAITVVGPIIGGLLAEAGLWRGVFLINLPLGLTALVVLRYKVPESRDVDRPRQIDYTGALLAAIGLTSLTYGFLEAPASGFMSPRVSAALTIGAVCLLSFVFVEQRSEHPMLPLGLFRSRTFSGANLITLFLYGSLSVSIFFLPLNMVQIQGYSPTLAGLTFLPFAVMLTLLSRWAGAMADRIGSRPLIIVGTIITAGGLLQISTIGVTGGPADFWSTFFPGILLFGLGLGITVTPLTTTVMGALDTKYAGTASGINNAVSRTAGVFATAIIGSLALMAFTGALEGRAGGLALSDSVRVDVLAEAGKLGDASVPGSVPPSLTDSVDGAYQDSFIDAFRTVIYISTGLVLVSTLIAATMLEPRSGRRGEVRPS